MRASDLLKVRVGQIAIFTGPAVTLVITPNSNFDPINLIKLLVLSVASLGFLGLFVANFKFFYIRLGRPLIVLSGLFIFWLTLSFLFSDAHWEQQVWGVWGRSTGILTYILLCLLMLAVASVQLEETYSRLAYALVFVSLLEISYMAIQTLGKDPVGWSRKEAFGTLGNINFSSAFIGIAMVALVALFFFGNISRLIKVLILLLLLADFLIIFNTGSIQGPAIFLIGAVLVITLKYWSKGLILRIFTLSFISLSSVAGVAGLLNRGPLASVLFQDTLLFRKDYWFAGWQMTIDSPLFGKGMDSYGDYYREFRGLEATVRTGPDRISNSAHNIYLDVSSGGGFPLIILYLMLLGFGFTGAIRYLRSTPNFAWHFVAVSGAWIAYHVQALVSINQIGVGIWGWILTGALIGYGKIPTDTLAKINLDDTKTKVKGKKVAGQETGFSYRKTRGEPLPARSLIAMISGMAIGFLIASPPFFADKNFKAAIQTRQIEKMESALNANGISAFHYEHVIQSAALANLTEPARRVTTQLLEIYPRNYYGWRITYQLAQTEEEKNRAQIMMRRLDPFNSTP